MNERSAARREILRAYERGLLPGAYRRLRLLLGGLPELAGLLPDRGTVVDLACGEGLLCHLLARKSAEMSVIGVDSDPVRIERLRKSAGSRPIRAVHGRMERFPLPSCDGVALVDVLHYLDEGEQERLLHRIARALRPGGVLVLRDPDAGAGARFRVAELHERVFLGLGFTKATLGTYRTAAHWARSITDARLSAEVLPLPGCTPYADRTIVGRKR